jgi:hypothetical protein
MAQKNTVLLIEPRILEHLPNILKNAQQILGTSWNYVFYCGKGTKSYWEEALNNDISETGIDIRELPVTDFPDPRIYNDFLKEKTIWESVEGDYVLTIQSDTWIMKHPKYTIDFFINLNKSFIGGNCDYRWHEFIRENISFQYPNFNGGLSLRKRKDLLSIIETFPPEPTQQWGHDSKKMETDGEDVYFVQGCIRLGLGIGDNEECTHFAVHSYYVDGFFGIHNPYHEFTKSHLRLNHPELIKKNPYLCLLQK